jgi:hypothetical protein
MTYSSKSAIDSAFCSHIGGEAFFVEGMECGVEKWGTEIGVFDEEMQARKLDFIDEKCSKDRHR